MIEVRNWFVSLYATLATVEYFDWTCILLLPKLLDKGLIILLFFVMADHWLDSTL